MQFLWWMGREPVILTSSVHAKLLKIYIPFVVLKLYSALGKELSKMKLALHCMCARVCVEVGETEGGSS